MPRLCTVCAHPQRQQIDFDLLRHVASHRELARRYGLQDDPLLRHQRKHLLWTFAKSKELQAMLSANNLLQRLSELDDRTGRLLTAAEQQGEIRTALVAIRESRGNIEAFSRISLEQDIERKIADIEQRLAAMNGGTPPTP